MCWPTKIRVTLLSFLLTALPGAAGLRCLCQPVGGAGAQDAAFSQLMQGAQASLSSGDLDGAAAKLKQVLAQDDRHKAARVALCHVLIRLSRLPEAESQVEILRRQFPDEAEPLYVAALVAFQRGQMEQVCELGNQALARGDQRAEVYKLLALAEYLLRRYDKFESHIRAAIKQNPLDAEPHYHLGRYYFEDKRYDEALDAFKEAARRQPDHFKAHYYAGLVYEGRNELGQAKQEFQTAIRLIDRLKISYAWPFADLGRLLVNEGEYERGLGWLYRATRNDPASPPAWYGYAKALFKKEATAEVKQALLEAIHLDPGYSEAYYLLARYYQKTGEAQMAKDTFAKFDELKKNPIPSPYGLRRW